MFTGIVEATVPLTSIKSQSNALEVGLSRPPFFDDLKAGDSIACDGVCLTLESWDSSTLFFTLGAESLSLLRWTPENLQNRLFHLERSLTFGDRVHGHLVSGHVDALTTLVERQSAGDCLLLAFDIPEAHRSQVWRKSSVCISGVSLTVNEVREGRAWVCLIPETLRRTHLGHHSVGAHLNLETDYYFKGLLQSQEALSAQ